MTLRTHLLCKLFWPALRGFILLVFVLFGLALLFEMGSALVHYSDMMSLFGEPSQW